MILAIDQGTTGTSCLAFDERARPIGRGACFTVDTSQILPLDEIIGWLETTLRLRAG